MLERTAAYEAAIVGSPRHIFLRAVVDISDPDKTFLPTTSSSEAPWSSGAELYDRDFNAPPRYATCERGRWLGDGSFDIFPDGYREDGDRPQGWASDNLSDSAAAYTANTWVAENFAGMSILQAFSLFFSTDPLDGVPEDFTVEVLFNNQVFYSQTVTGNHETAKKFDAFTVFDPTAIRVTVTKWTLPSRYARIVEIVPGIYEDWDADMFSRFSVTQQGQFSNLTVPYGSADISIDNHTRRFDPRRKDGVFQSIQERQGLGIYIGVLLSAGGVEFMSMGVFYQAADGWKQSSNAMDMRWLPVDIIGLITDRSFIPLKDEGGAEKPLPTTLEGWLQALVGQLGKAFEKRYRVDPNFANLPVTANSRDDVAGKKCGDILKWVCQASGTWSRANSRDGALTAEPLWNQGQTVKLENLESYPDMGPNRSIAALIFYLSDGTEYVISGNSTSSEETPPIRNPFIHTGEQALAAARLILSQYGGTVYETVGRGDPAGEIGDVDTIWLDESNAVTARRMSQTFSIENGALICRSKLIQADGSYLYTEYAIMEDEEGDFQIPADAVNPRLVLSDGGQGGGYGRDGTVAGAWSGSGPSGTAAGYGEPGQDGTGGKVWYGVINVNPGGVYHYKRGKGGAAATKPGVPGEMGGPSTFGVYSSADGVLYHNGYTDIANGKAFCRPGVPAPLPGTGDGGKGGDGGEPGSGYWEALYWTSDIPGYSEANAGNPRGHKFIVTQPPGPGKPGVAGGSGFIMLTWAKPQAAENTEEET